MTFHGLALEARDVLEDAGISPITAAFDVEILARHILGWHRAAWLARRGETASEEFRRDYSTLISRRATREPVAYIRGVQEFWDREFEVGPAVLIPRPETELLIETAEPFLRDQPHVRVVDLGTGSGCIAVTLALEHPEAAVFATDVSADALDVARRNAIRLGAPRVKFCHGTLLADVDVPVDVIVTNPPYVARADRPGLAPEVRDYEPDTALYGSDDGLGVIRSILDVSRSALRPDGHLIIEIGYGQDDRVQHLVSNFPEFVLEATIEDLQRIPRVMVLRNVVGRQQPATGR